MKFLGKVAGDITNSIKEANEERKERIRLKEEQDERERWIREQELQAKLQLLDKFEFPQLKQLCLDVLGREPPEEYVEDEKSGAKHKIVKDRHDYVEFIIDESGLNLANIKDYALKRKIVPPSFFGEESKVEEQKKDFESIMNSIRTHFEPEKIDSEEHLEAQIMIFLKAKYPERKVSRQVEISPNERLDILIDDKYAFELKVPRNKTELRNLGAQLQEYSEKYPNICAIILDDSNLNLTSEINEYVDKYKRDHGIRSIVLSGERRV